MPREGPVEPGAERLDVVGVDGGAAPDAQARRGVAIGGDVVGRAFELEQRVDLLGQRAARLLVERTASANFRQTLVLLRVAGSAARCSIQSVRSTQAASAAALASARAISASRPPCSSRPFERPDIILDREHRRRVDRLALEDALDQLAALGQPEDLRAAARRACGFPAARPRAGRGSACRAPPSPPSTFCQE